MKNIYFLTAEAQKTKFMRAMAVFEDFKYIVVPIVAHVIVSDERYKQVFSRLLTQIGPDLTKTPIIAIVGEEHVASEYDVFSVSNGVQEAFIRRENLCPELIRKLAYEWQFEFQEHKIG